MNINEEYKIFIDCCDNIYNYNFIININELMPLAHCPVFFLSATVSFC